MRVHLPDFCACETSSRDRRGQPSCVCLLGAPPCLCRVGVNTSLDAPEHPSSRNRSAAFAAPKNSTGSMPLMFLNIPGLAGNALVLARANHDVTTTGSSNAIAAWIPEFQAAVVPPGNSFVVSYWKIYWLLLSIIRGLMLRKRYSINSRHRKNSPAPLTVTTRPRGLERPRRRRRSEPFSTAKRHFLTENGRTARPQNTLPAHSDRPAR